MIHAVKIALLSLIFFNTTWASDCPVEFKDKNICASIDWVRGPLWGGFSKATITYFKKDDPEQKVDLPKDMILYIWMVMDEVEHGGRTPKITKKETGVYEVDQLQFMKMDTGNWEIRWRQKKTDEKKDALAVYPVPLEN